MKRIDPEKPWLWHVNEAAAACVKLARETGEEVRCEFNGTDLVVPPGTTASDAVAAWDREMSRKADEYRASPEFKRAEKERQRVERERKAASKAALAGAPAISLREPEKWATCVRVNSSPYGAAAVRYAETWARIMQARMAAGATVADCAEESSRLADNGGITGFQYGCAVSILTQTWEHGEELRRWHNLKTQIRNEGERANETGGVLNPALLTSRKP